jgi:2-haloacid dehalogenase
LTVKAILFDAYGTLLDVHDIAVLAERHWLGSGQRLSALWRDKQLQYTWLRTLSHNYADFLKVTGEALDFATGRLGLAMTAEIRTELMAAYERLAPFPDAAPTLAALAERGVPLAVLSNGTPLMLERAFGAAGLSHRFSALLSVDSVKRYKTAPEAYQIAVDRFGGAPGDYLLVSSNGWDVAGANVFGFRTFWVNRGGLPVEQLGVVPTGIGSSLLDLAPWLDSDQIPR